LIYKDIFTKQKPMRIVMLSLIPVYIYSVYLFGLRILLLGLIVLLIGTVTEYLIMRNINKDKVRISEAVFVTCLLYTLTLPPTVPFWIAGIGIIFGVLFGKGVFGGFGKNIFNPALAGRCFIYISFSRQMTNTWAIPFVKFPGGFKSFSPDIDMITTATPMKTLLDTGISYINLFLGNISGSAGETSALLIILAGAFLVYKKVADYRIIGSTLVSFIVITSAFYILDTGNTDPLFSLLSGGFLFGAVFMATDPISAPKDKISKYVYGAIIGILSFAIRRFALFTEGIMFSILIANMFAPFIDRNIKDIRLFMKNRKTERGAA
jgi:Na+-transporting NADH:ubiquinone oxidoreductase subunit B